jgi:ComF family protein
VLCAPCVATILPPPGPLCPRCGLPTSAAATCVTCARRPPAFRSARALALYRPAEDPQNPLTRAIQLLKYGRRRPIAGTLGRLLAERYPFASDATIVPVPLHPSRLRQRGFNQAALLALHLGRRRHLPVLLRALVKQRPTPAQAALRAVDRWRNLDETFVVRDPRVLDGRHIVLLDDVLTTGATADACAAALCVAGAATVDVYTVARAP